MAYNASQALPAVVFQNWSTGVEIAFLDATAFGTVTASDLSSLVFTTELVDMPLGNSNLPTRPEYIDAVMKVLYQNDELIVRDMARLGGLTQTQVRRALEELVASGKVVVRKLERPRKTLYRIGDQG